ncbi:LytR family transcriptional regulator [Mesobacillus zeae]|uniref:LytR family transcriptional regulator n=2 Tax=Mesobacillus zeae TaxID=1917180 RepID=A0A398B4Z5_9BACI|nr:LytR family transcriptional regulator [Mesobacillus zeae]
MLTLSGLGYGAYLYTKAADVLGLSKVELSRGDQSAKRFKKVDPKHDNISMLIMGVDDSKTRDQGKATRTDALILATFNKDDKTVKMVSIPRDSYVYIPAEEKRDKITHAHVYGGEEGTIETVEEMFDIPVDYFVKLNFDAFIDVVEALGGIKVDVPVEFTEQNSKDTGDAIHLKKGVQELNGEEALALARTRKIDNDIERGKRQQLVLKAIIDKAISAGSLTKYGDVMEALGDNITTNMEFGELLSLYDYATKGIDIESLTMEGEDAYIDDVYYYQLDEQKLIELSSMFKSHLALSSLSSDRSDGTESEDTESNY